MSSHPESAIKYLTDKDFSLAFSDDLSNFVKNRIKEYSFKYIELSTKQSDALLLKVIQTLLSKEILRSGEHRRDQWEFGWRENLELFLNHPDNIELLIPKYFDKYNAIRWMGRFIEPVSEKFELHSLSIILDWLFDMYLRDVDAIYEFGCGTAHNLFRVRAINTKANLYGLDWAKSSQEIISKIGTHKVDTNMFGLNFDYFKPNYDINIVDNAAIYTVASLEQVGNLWRPFLDYLIEKHPKLCIHVEPISELLDDSCLIDFLSIRYFERRNYLSGFLEGLKQFERLGKVKIHRAQRTHIGSLFIEGYSVIVWSPT